MRIVFLDRDGVISKYYPGDWSKKWEEFSFLPKAKEALKRLTKANYRIVIISNQAGVNKGLFGPKILRYITKRMKEEVKKSGGKIKKVYYCPHQEEDNCLCRKPKVGLFKKAERDLGYIDFEKTFFVGDSEVDILAGKNIGSKTILVLSGKTKSKEETKDWQKQPDYIATDLLSATEIILKLL
ncbi:MAG: HAD family hydrolase [Candidatus Omnitrophica bacterium]|nr:HAD family hydrolase [Candidatus Omnitrophota bacterium]